MWQMSWLVIILNLITWTEKHVLTFSLPQRSSLGHINTIPLFFHTMDKLPCSIVAIIKQTSFGQKRWFISFPYVLLHYQINTCRISMSRLEYLTKKQDNPFYLTIAPVSPHVEIPGLPVPLARHAKDFPNATAPQGKNFNPSDALTAQKPSWLKKLPLMEESDVTRANEHYRHRIRALQGVDEIVQDIVDFLDKTNILNNTYSKLLIDLIL